MQPTSRPVVRPNALDRAIGWITPRAAAKRYSARVALAHLVRAYDGAARGRRTDGWNAASSSADAELAAARAPLRDRCRAEERNNPLFANAISIWANILVGDGIRPRAATGNKALDKLLNERWERWGRFADADGHGDVYSLQTLACRGMVRDGETFARRRLRRAGDMPKIDGVELPPLQLQLYEPDHIDDAKDQVLSDGVIRQGIEYDAIGRRRAYWLFPEHPGDAGVTVAFRRRLESVRVPADSVAHLFERQRVQQRGAPWGAPALRKLKDFEDWSDAEGVRKKTEACLAAIVFGADEADQGIAPAVEDGDGNRVETLEPGFIAYARGGKDIKFTQPATTGGIGEWNRTQGRIIAAAWRMTYELLFGDLEGVNYSSYKAGDIKFRRLARAMQWQVVIPMLCQPMWDWFVLAGWAAGLWDVQTAAVEWDPPAFEEADRLKEIAADLVETRGGFTTLQRQHGKRGYDTRSTLDEIAEANELIDERELVLDSDPRKVTKAGGMQGKSGGDDAAEDGSEGDSGRGVDVRDVIDLVQALEERDHGRRANGRRA
jgi:lambda family phage portal protein